MKRAAQWLFGFKKEPSPEELLLERQEQDAGEILRCFCEDKTSACALLVELPCIVELKEARARASKLLDVVKKMELSEGDIVWIRALELATRSRDALASHELARLMVIKKCWAFLAKRIDDLRLESILQELHIDSLYELFTAVKTEASIKVRSVQILDPSDSVAPAAKRRRVSCASRPAKPLLQTPPLDEGTTLALMDGVSDEMDHICCIGRVLVDKLIALASTAEIRHVTIGRLRDVVVELYECSARATFLHDLLNLIDSDHNALDLDRWGSEVGLPLLQQVVENLLGRATASDEALRLVYAHLASILGSRHHRAGNLSDAGLAYRRALTLHPQHPSSQRDLLQVMLMQYTRGEEVALPALLELLAAEGQWNKLVELYDDFKVLPSTFAHWDETRLRSLADELSSQKKFTQAAPILLELGMKLEQQGNATNAFESYRKSFELQQSDEAEGGMSRLALAAGRVEDAATHFLLANASGSSSRSSWRIREFVRLLVAHAEKLASDGTREAAEALSNLQLQNALLSPRSDSEVKLLPLPFQPAGKCADVPRSFPTSVPKEIQTRQASSSHLPNQAAAEDECAERAESEQGAREKTAAEGIAIGQAASDAEIEAAGDRAVEEMEVAEKAVAARSAILDMLAPADATAEAEAQAAKEKLASGLAAENRAAAEKAAVEFFAAEKAAAAVVARAAAEHALVEKVVPEKATTSQAAAEEIARGQALFEKAAAEKAVVALGRQRSNQTQVNAYEVQKLRRKYPNRVPVICRPAPWLSLDTSSCSDKIKLLVPESMTFKDLQGMIKKKVAQGMTSRGVLVSSQASDPEQQLAYLQMSFDMDDTFAQFCKKHDFSDMCVPLIYNVESASDGGCDVKVYLDNLS